MVSHDGWEAALGLYADEAYLLPCGFVQHTRVAWWCTLYSTITISLQGGVRVREASVRHDRRRNAHVPDAARADHVTRGRQHGAQGPARFWSVAIGGESWTRIFEICYSRSSVETLVAMSPSLGLENMIPTWRT